jgi:hypothetical protein
MARTRTNPLQPAIPEGRRRATRYELCLKVRYAILRHEARAITGAGESLNLSISGLLFQAESRFHKGDSVVAALDWPVPAPNNEPLLLVMTGYVVRTRYPHVAVSIASKRLLRASEVDERFDEYFARPGNAAPRERQIAVVDENAAAVSVVAGILGPRWTLRRADAESVKWILASGLPQIGLLITCTAALLEYVPPGLPVILTVDEGAPERLPEKELPRLAVVPRARMRTMLADVIQKICRPSPSDAEGAPPNVASA